MNWIDYCEPFFCFSDHELYGYLSTVGHSEWNYRRGRHSKGCIVPRVPMCKMHNRSSDFCRCRLQPVSCHDTDIATVLKYIEIYTMQSD